MTEPAINTGEILEALNDKVDRDCRNVDTTSGADVVIEYQVPTSSNNYTWYRKYKSGWVEQGGYGTGEPLVNSARHYDLPIKMADTNYFASAISKRTDSGFYQSNPANIVDVTTTSFGVRIYNNTLYELAWKVEGMSAQS